MIVSNIEGQNLSFHNNWESYLWLILCFHWKAAVCNSAASFTITSFSLSTFSIQSRGFCFLSVTVGLRTERDVYVEASAPQLICRCCVTALHLCLLAGFSLAAQCYTELRINQERQVRSAADASGLLDELMMMCTDYTTTSWACAALTALHTVSKAKFHLGCSLIDSHTVFGVNVGENEKQRGHNAATLRLFNAPSDWLVYKLQRQTKQQFLPP